MTVLWYVLYFYLAISAIIFVAMCMSGWEMREGWFNTLRMATFFGLLWPIIITWNLLL